MTEHERVDLSAIDPARDPARWEGLVQTTLARVDTTLRRRMERDSALGVIEGWARPLLAAAAIGFLALAGAELLLEAAEDRRERIERLVTLSTGWSASERPPAGADFVRALIQERSR
jgi:hypothetical protein